MKVKTKITTKKKLIGCHRWAQPTIEVARNGNHERIARKCLQANSNLAGIENAKNSGSTSLLQMCFKPTILCSTAASGRAQQANHPVALHGLSRTGWKQEMLWMQVAAGANNPW